jgi:hypothetical protein
MPQEHRYHKKVYDTLRTLALTERAIQRINCTPGERLTTRDVTTRLDKLHDKNFQAWSWLVEMASIGCDHSK